MDVGAEVVANVDIVALQLTAEGSLNVLLCRRAREPFINRWALPGVVVNGRCVDASLDAAAERALDEKAQISPVYLEQVATEGNASRDPRGWTLTTYYLALLGPEVQVPEGLSWQPLSAVASGEVELPFDHNLLVARAQERLASRSVYTSLPLYLLSERFTVNDALNAFHGCLGHEVQHTTLRGRLERMKQAGWIADTGDKNFPPQGRPQVLYAHTPQPRQVFVFDRTLLNV